MATIKISALPAAIAGNVTDATVLPLVDATTTTVKMTLAQLRTQIVNSPVSYLSTISAAATPVLDARAAGLNESYMNLINTGNSSSWGVESSAGSHIFGTTAAYATVFGTSSARAVQLVTNNVVQLSIASTGVVTFTSQAILPLGTTSLASLRIPHGAAPTSPVNGDVWTTTAGIFVRVNGATVGPLS